MQIRFVILIIISIIVSGCGNSIESSPQILTEQALAAAKLIALAENGVTSNADWTPYIQEFNGVEMVLVPVGCFIMGSTDEQLDYITDSASEREYYADEQPNHEYCFKVPFWIDRYEVSNAQFAQFNGYAAISSRWRQANLPREQITWFEARIFCEQRDVRLPTEAEWEYAARGPDSVIFPWGDEFDSTRLNYCDTNCDSVLKDSSSDDGFTYTAPVEEFANGSSWVGAYQMSGNVWEWTSTIYDRFPYPYVPDDGREIVIANYAVRVMRGDSWNGIPPHGLRSAARSQDIPDHWSFYVGFRCARDL
jgi:formylglycine-generating enzyme required for sulfatase activity